MVERDRHAESCPLHWLPKGHAGAKCWCNLASSQAPSDDVVELNERNFARGFLSGLDHVAGFINSLDSADMSGKQVRSAIYSECLTARPTRTPTATPSDEVVEKVAVAIERADRGKVPDGYADGISDHEEVSDWGVYLATAAIAALQAVPTASEVGWQPIETAPDDELILVWDYGSTQIALRSECKWISMWKGIPGPVTPTFWCRLPPPPKGTGK